MASLELIIDCSLLIEAYNKGVEAGFIMATDYTELDSELNCNSIDTVDIEDKDDI